MPKRTLFEKQMRSVHFLKLRFGNRGVAAQKP